MIDKASDRPPTRSGGATALHGRVRTRTRRFKVGVDRDETILMNGAKPRITAAHGNGFRVTVEPLDPEGALVTVQGELDISTAPQLRASLTDALDAGVRRLVVDLHGVAFLDSMALAVLLQAATRIAEHGRLAVVVAPDSYARLIFRVAGCPRVLDLFDTLDDALTHVHG